MSVPITKKYKLIFILHKKNNFIDYSTLESKILAKIFYYFQFFKNFSHLINYNETYKYLY